MVWRLHILSKPVKSKFLSRIKDAIVHVLDTRTILTSPTDYYPSKQFEYVPELQLYKKDNLGAWQHRDDVARLDPLARFICYKIPETIFDDGFKFVDKQGEDIEALNTTVLESLEQLDWRRVFASACKYQRIHRWSVIYLGEGLDEPLPNDLQDLSVFTEQPLRYGAPITSLHPLAGERDIQVMKVDQFGKPTMYRVIINMKQSQEMVQKQFNVHPSRVIVINPHPIRYGQVEGESALDPIWDDLVLYRWVKYFMSFSAIKYGGGVSVFKREQGGALPDGELTAIKSVAHEISQATGVTLPGNWDLKWEGPTSQPNYPAMLDALLNNIAAGSGIPKVILKGAEAGSLTSGTTNERELYATISNIMEAFEPFVKILAKLVAWNMADAIQSAFMDWAFDFTLDAKGQQEVEQLKWEVINSKTTILTVNEIRKEEGYPPVDDGDKVLGLSQGMFGMESEFGQEEKPSKEEEKPQSKREKEIIEDANILFSTNFDAFSSLDNYVKAHNLSVTKLCKDIKMSKATYYDLRKKRCI